MAKYLIEITTLTGIADVVRAEEGTTSVIPVPDIKNRMQTLFDDVNDLLDEINGEDVTT